MATHWKTSVIAAAFLGSTTLTVNAEDNDHAKTIIETNNCTAHIADNRPETLASDLFIASLRYIGCALQTRAAGKNMENISLIQYGDVELGKAVIYLQNNINNYIVEQSALFDGPIRDKLFLSGTLDYKTRSYLYDYALQLGLHDVFVQTAPVNEIGDDVSTLFYLREHLKTLDTDQYIEAMRESMRHILNPPRLHFYIVPAPTLCDTQTPLANAYRFCPEI